MRERKRERTQKRGRTKEWERDKEEKRMEERALEFYPVIQKWTSGAIKTNGVLSIHLQIQMPL
jgi:hypothetical protein